MIHYKEYRQRDAHIHAQRPKPRPRREGISKRQRSAPRTFATLSVGHGCVAAQATSPEKKRSTFVRVRMGFIRVRILLGLNLLGLGLNKF